MAEKFAALKKAKVLEGTETQAHDWRDDGLDTHKGEYWYRCALCGASDWIASYGTKDQLMPRECKPPNPKMTGASPVETLAAPAATEGE